MYSLIPFKYVERQGSGLNVGKDQTAFSYCIEKCLEHPNFRVVYIFPLAKQGKQNILDGVTFEGKNWIESIVDISVLKRPKSGALYFYDLSIKFKNGSTIQFVGDDANALVGKLNCSR